MKCGRSKPSARGVGATVRSNSSAGSMFPRNNCLRRPLRHRHDRCRHGADDRRFLDLRDRAPCARGGRLVGLADTEIGSLFPDGDMSKELGDAEDVALDPTDRSRGVIVRERQANAMLTFDLVDGRPTNFEPKLVGAPDRILRSNSGWKASPLRPRHRRSPARSWRSPNGRCAAMTIFTGWIAGKGAFRSSRTTSSTCRARASCRTAI